MTPPPISAKKVRLLKAILKRYGVKTDRAFKALGRDIKAEFRAGPIRTTAIAMTGAGISGSYGFGAKNRRDH